MNIAVVRAEFNQQYTDEMLEAAQNKIEEAEAELRETVEVPGVHEIPLAAARLLRREDIDGVVALGAVIEGATDHDQVIAQNVSKQLIELSCEEEKPVGYGVIGPGVSWAQVEQRTEQYAEEAVEAVVDMS
jgi:6,7-dimethyl-8-ribityllumazine synthase|nr:MAG: 6,7-dimethyl-8-ribityllumazine synthase [Candidatus Nanosalinarum sp. J07AB56]